MPTIGPQELIVIGVVVLAILLLVALARRKGR
jgi:hypothetical protein